MLIGYVLLHIKKSAFFLLKFNFVEFKILFLQNKHFVYLYVIQMQLTDTFNVIIANVFVILCIGVSDVKYVGNFN